MKIIQVHNYYQQAGGEDAVVAAERALLEAKGNVVVPFFKSNDVISGGQQTDAGGRRTSISHLLSVIGLLRLSAQTIWNHQTYREFRKLLQNGKPDVVHCHNTFPLISPSIYWACAKEGVPVVQTLHNYRLLCLNAFLFRQTKAVSCEQLAVSNEKTKSHELKAKGSICELCLTKPFKWPGIRYSCYRDSKAGSLVVAVMLFVHNLIGTWSKKVTAYIALTEFQKKKMIEGGLPEDKILVKPNFIYVASIKQKSEVKGQASEQEELIADVRSLISGRTPFALFVGRLSAEKGCDVLIRAWHLFCEKRATERTTSELSPTNNEQRSTDNQPQLIIVGDGPEREALKKMTSAFCPPSSVNFLGKQPKESVRSLMRHAQFLVSPSVCYETFGLVVLESGIQRTPAIISTPGAVASLIHDGESGILFKTDDEAVLAEKIDWALSHPAEMHALGKSAQKRFEDDYSAETNYRRIMEIYDLTSVCKENS